MGKIRRRLERAEAKLEIIMSGRCAATGIDRTGGGCVLCAYKGVRRSTVRLV